MSNDTTANECGTVGEMKVGGETEVLGENLP
jgi:hypothetical protein